MNKLNYKYQWFEQFIDNKWVLIGYNTDLKKGYKCRLVDDKDKIQLIKQLASFCGCKVSDLISNKEYAIENKEKIEEIGQSCRDCGTPVILKHPKKKNKRLRQLYYFTAYFYCPTCRKMYMHDKYKVYNT